MWIAGGLDFGNKNCVIGIPRKNGVDVILNQSSNRLTPTMVTYSDDRRYSGEMSQQQQSMNIDTTIDQLKRLVCLEYNSKEREIIQQNVQFQLIELKDGYTGIKINYKGEEMVLRPEQCIAYLFKELDKIAKTSEPKISKYVIAISPWWGEPQRRAILNACKIANIQCLSLINSTTAAAIDYAMIHPEKLEAEKQKPYVFIDFGNSSMNVAVILLKYGNVEVKSFDDDNELGGDQFTIPLSNYLLSNVKQKYNIDPTTNPKAMIRFRNAVEKTKKMLSVNPVVNFEVENLMGIDVSFIVNRKTFEEQIQGLLDRIEAPILRAIESAKLDIKDIQEVELLGGGSRVPAVKAKIAEIFGKEPGCLLNLDECFAQGSGFFSALLSPSYKLPLVVKDVTPYSIMAEWSDGHPKQKELFPRFSQLPSVSEFQIKTVGKTPIKIISNEKTILNIELETGIENEVDVTLRLRLNQSGVIEIDSAKYKAENDEEIPVNVTVNIPNEFSKEEIEEYQKLEKEMSDNDELKEKIDNIKNDIESDIFKLDVLLRDSTDYFEPNEELESTRSKKDEIQNWFYDNEFNQLTLEEYEEKYKAIHDLITPIEEKKKKYQDLSGTIDKMKGKLNELLISVQKDEIHQEDPDSKSLQEDLTKAISDLDALLTKPKYSEIGFDEDKAKNDISDFEKKVEELKNKKIQPPKDLEKDEQEIQRQQQNDSDDDDEYIKEPEANNEPENYNEEEDSYDPWQALFGKPYKKRNRFPQRYQPEREFQRTQNERRKQYEDLLRKQEEEEERRRQQERRRNQRNFHPQRTFVRDDDDDFDDFWGPRRSRQQTYNPWGRSAWQNPFF